MHLDSREVTESIAYKQSASNGPAYLLLMAAMSPHGMLRGTPAPAATWTSGDAAVTDGADVRLHTLTHSIPNGISHNGHGNESTGYDRRSFGAESAQEAEAEKPRLDHSKPEGGPLLQTSLGSGHHRSDRLLALVCLLGGPILAGCLAVGHHSFCQHFQGQPSDGGEQFWPRHVAQIS